MYDFVGLKVTNVVRNLFSENKLIIIHVSCVDGIQSLQIVCGTLLNSV